MSEMQEAAEEFQRLMVRIETLLARLQEVDALWMKPMSDFKRLEAAGIQLNAVMDFLYSIDDLRRSARPMAALHQMVFELITGRDCPLVEAARTKHGGGGRRPAAWVHETLKIYAAVAAHLLIAAGERKADACRQVASRLDRFGFKRGDGKPITARSVALWRESGMSGNPDPMFAERLKNTEAEFRSRNLWPPKPSDVKRFLDSLPSILTPPTPLAE